MFLPPYDTGATLLALAALVLRRNPRRVISLGDSFHDSAWLRPAGATADRARLSALQRGRDWIWVSGNHDPELPADIGGDIVGRASHGRAHSAP